MASKRISRLIGGLVAVLAAGSWAQAPSVAHDEPTIKQLMTLIVEPASNGVFRAASEPPTNDTEWKTLQGQALMLWELAKTLSAPNRAKDRKQWLIDARAFAEESKKAFASAMAMNAKAFEELSDSLYTTCENCHRHYLPKP